jgi:hypothetical protein
MEVILAGILSGIVVLLCFLPFWVARDNSIKRALSDIRRRSAELQKQLDAVQKKLNALAQQSDLPAPSLSNTQTESTSSEITILKTELVCVRRDLEVNSRMLSILTDAIKTLEEKYAASWAAETKSSESLSLQVNRFADLSRSQETSPFPELGTFAGLGSEQPMSTATDVSPVEAPAPQPPEPFDQVLQNYQDALDRGDRQALRRMQLQSLNITSDTENSLMRGRSDQSTTLEAVLGGGSYMVVSDQSRYWLFPTAQTLDGFSMNQPQKGIFSYSCEVLSRPAVKRPAEVREEGNNWIVVDLGIISVPG